MVAPDDHGGGQLAVGHHLVEGKAQPVPVSQPHPADTRRQALEGEAALQEAGGRILHFGPIAQVLEGDETPLPMAGVFEFPTLAQALSFYNSERYAPIKAERREAQQARMFVVETG
jgi:uncharacterized protein (DUF1330 family)